MTEIVIALNLTWSIFLFIHSRNIENRAKTFVKEAREAAKMLEDMIKQIELKQNENPNLR